MDSYRANLGTQTANLRNAIVTLIEDVLEDDIETPTTTLLSKGDWLTPLKMGKIDQRLRQCLDQDYDIFVANLESLSFMLMDLRRKLNLDIESQEQVATKSQDILLGQVRKFKDIFSKTVYESLLAKIESTNSALRTLLGDAAQREHRRRKHRTSTRPLARQRAFRRYAKSFRAAFLDQGHWHCTADHSHKVDFFFNEKAVSMDDDEPDNRGIIFRVAVLEDDGKGHELEVVPVLHLRKVKTLSSTHLEGLKEQTGPKGGKKVQFSLATATLSSLPWTHLQEDVDQQVLNNICKGLSIALAPGENRRCLGCLHEKTSDDRHNLYVVRSLSSLRQVATFYESLAIAAAQTALWMAEPDSLGLWRNRLRIAALLAANVIGLHGNWLFPSWNTGDLLLVEDTEAPGKDGVKHLCLTFPVPQWSSLSGLQSTLPSSPLIQNKVLFPLGLALVELAFCQSLKAMQLPQEVDPDGDVTKLKTASRLLDAVALHCGERYGSVARKCLFWNGPRAESLDDEDFQNAVYDEIVSPLIEDLKTAQRASSWSK
ncbi:hypothetical protein LTR84_006422 [Exophiala bonariae]|uniref:DUF7580 domain-containing protein n=1 Tax=Exophiala bonariae TaxID=1690606 RepID=A0AAV9N1G8_9EURO|nr:hypothetical protein LTR84_006422 [Exophiala bonariae]